MDDSLGRKILDKYDLKYDYLLPEQKGYRNHCRAAKLTSGEMVNIILYKNEPNIIRTIRDADNVSNFLADHEMPTRKSLNLPLKLSSQNNQRYVGIYNYLPGETIEWEAYTRDHIKTLGQMMSNMHSLLADNPIIVTQSAAQTNATLAAQVAHYFSSESVHNAVWQKLSLEINQESVAQCMQIIQLCDQLPDQRPLHMDFVRGNILFTPTPHDDLRYTITGVLDFEKTAYGHPVLDIARTMAFLQVDCRSNVSAKISKYFLQSGYNKRGKTTYRPLYITYHDQTTDVLDSLIGWFLLYDFYKFLCHTPYESLSENHHYVRTRDILMTRKMLKYKV